MPILLKVNGKGRIIRDRFIHCQNERVLECTYRNHLIYIRKTKNDFYVSVTDKTGGHIVNGGFSLSSFKECLAMAIENILL